MSWARATATRACVVLCGVVVAVAATRADAQQPTGPITISVVGTNDLHGHIEVLPVFAGYVANLRRARRAGGVVLLDAGDMFQGTLESNLGEGAAVVRAYNALRYTAVAIGNHEFDFGPVGERATPAAPTDDPVGALRARARELRMPMLAANIIDAATGAPVTWQNVRPSTVARIARVRVGIIGVTTSATLSTTIAANTRGLRIAPLAETIRAQAEALRRDGATVILVSAHAGGDCRRFGAPADLSSCDDDEEIFAVARALPAGLVDVIVAGHTHARVAHVVNGIAIIESGHAGRAFGRVDLSIDRSTGRVVSAALQPPRDMCAQPEGPCEPGDYEGAAVVPDRSVERVLRPDFERARALRERPLGVTVAERIRRAHGTESALGNLFADLMRSAHPEAAVAMTNGGGLRADIAEGALTYGRLFEAFPFDNRFAIVRLRARDLVQLIAHNLTRDTGLLSFSGVRAVATCENGRLAVRVTRDDGTALRDDEELVLATSDFLATGGDDVFAALARQPGAIAVDEVGPNIRDAMAEVLRRRGGTLRPAELLDRDRRRITYAGERPVRCAPARRPVPPPRAPAVRH